MHNPVSGHKHITNWPDQEPSSMEISHITLPSQWQYSSSPTKQSWILTMTPDVSFALRKTLHKWSTIY